MATLSLQAHPYCFLCGSLCPALFDPAVQYDSHIHHLSCATKTILEKSLTPHEPPHHDLPKNIHPRFKL